MIRNQKRLGCRVVRMPDLRSRQQIQGSVSQYGPGHVVALDGRLAWNMRHSNHRFEVASDISVAIRLAIGRIIEPKLLRYPQNPQIR